MPRREKDRELARRRKRKKEVRKLRAKGVLPPTGTVVSPKEVEKKKVVKYIFETHRNEDFVIGSGN